MFIVASQRGPARRPTVVVLLLLALVLGASLVAKPAEASATGEITGTVTTTSGAALAGVYVDIYEPSGSGWTGFARVLTGSGGSYSIYGLAAGSYRIGFSDPSGDSLEEYWDDQASIQSARDIVVGDNARVSGVDASLAKGGRIVGHLTDATGTPQVQIQVTSYYRDPATGNGASYSVLTASDGSYVIGGRIPGSYQVSFSDPSGRLASEYFDDATTMAGATAVTVSAGRDALANARLAPASHITGVVTSAAGSAADGVYVTAYRHDPATGRDDLGAATTTDSSGHYNLGGLTAAIYRVEFRDWQGRYLTEDWNNQSDLAHADDISVGSGATVAGIDAALGSAGHITGTVTGTTGLSISQVYAVAYVKTSGYWDPVAYTYVGSDGRYDFGPLPAGTYRVNFGDDGGRYAPQWWNNEPTLTKAQDVVLTDQGVSGIDARLKVAAHLSGRVTDESGSPLGGVKITAYRQGPNGFDGGYGGYATSASDGTYDIGGLQGGSYQLGFADDSGRHLGEYWNDKATLQDADVVSVTAGRTAAGEDARLATAASISGVVTGDDGTPLAGITVSAQRAGTDPGAGSGGYATTDEHGAYTVGGLSGGKFRLSFQDYSGLHLDEYWNNKPTYETATLVPVAPGAAVTGKSPQLTTASHLTGTVTGSAGQPLAGAGVTAYAYSSADQDWEYVSSAVTDAAGRYDVGHLRADTYRLGFGAPGYASEYWRDQPTLARADGIKVGSRRVVGGKNAGLKVEGRIQGTVTDLQGRPVPSLNVQALTYDSSRGIWSFAGGTVTDEAGQYAIKGLPTNTYRVAFQPYEGQPYAPQFWNGKPDVSSADDVAVSSGSTVAGTNARLNPQAAISGHVTDNAGHGVGAEVYVFRRSTDGTYGEVGSTGTNNSSGAYTLSNLLPGTYRLEFEPFDDTLAGEYFDDAATLTTATDVVVSRFGAKVTGKDAVLGPAGAATAQEHGRATPPLSPPMLTPRPEVVGLPQVGAVLAARLPQPTPGTEAPHFQWLVGGVEIPAAISPTYTVAPQDIGRSISVELAPAGLGVEPLATSEPTSPVQQAPASRQPAALLAQLGER